MPPTVWDRATVKDPYKVRLAKRSDVVYVPRIRAMLEEAANAGAIVAVRSEAYLEEAIRERRSVLVLRGDLLVGFATAHAWQGNQYVSHSAMVISPSFRGRGLAKRLKVALVDLSRQLWPEATMMSLTLSPVVEGLNKAAGFEAVPYCDLTTDPSFWDGCRGCQHYGHLKRNQYQDCHCWAGALWPPNQVRDRVVPKDALKRPEDSL